MSQSCFIERPRGFCALGGAQLTIGAIPGAVPIMHTSVGCGGSIYWTQLGSTGYLGAGYVGGLAVPSSNVAEKDIIFGGVERLTEQVEHTLRIVNGELYVVMTGCMTDIIGDDIQSVVREFSDDARIIGVETGGFKGDGYVGYDLVLQALFRDFVTPSEEHDADLVNLWGIAPGQDAFWRGNLENLRALLESIGLKVNSFFTDRDSVDSFADAARASLNIVVSETYGIEAARVFEQTHGVEYLSTPFPIGPSATSEFLRSIGTATHRDADRVEEAVAAGVKRYFHFVERIADSYNDLDFQRYAVVVGDANYASALTRFLADDLGWLPKLTVITDPIEDEYERELIGGKLARLDSGYTTTVVWETDASEIRKRLLEITGGNRGQHYYDSFSPAFVIGSSHERVLARDLGAGHLTVSFPVSDRVVLDRGYAGFEGSLTLIEDLFSVIVKER
jgi:nitrogenase molybdenum-iron protein beta chain